MTAPSRILRPRLARLAGAVLVAVTLGGAVGACSASHDPAAPAATPTHTAAADPAPTGAPVPLGDVSIPDAQEVAAAWGARPAFVAEAAERTQAAYAFALSSPHVLQWLPCYCGCGGQGHRSNLDCFMKPRDDEADPLQFEEHGSYCDVCVETALLADGMLRDGRTILEIRVAVDATFGGIAPGTSTELPPAG